jgi:adenosylcobyric acid synthase
VLGICGGLQMLGRRIADPDGIEGPAGEAAGLGLLELDTVLTGDKRLAAVTGRLADGGAAVEGYEMHVGRSDGPALARPLLQLADGRPEGAVSADGRIAGTYVHGLFGRGDGRAALLAAWGGRSAQDFGAGDHGAAVDAMLDEIAAILGRVLDVDGLAALAGVGDA